MKRSYGFLFLLLAFFSINILSTFTSLRLDLTREKRFTVTEGTKTLLRQFDSTVEVTVFLTGEFPSGFRKLASSTQQLLETFKRLQPGQFTYRFLSPGTEVVEGMTWSDSLQKSGALNINLTVQKEAGQLSNIIYPVALVSYRGNSRLVNLYSQSSRMISQDNINAAEALLEYQFVTAFDKLIHTRRPGIAYAVGHGEPTDSRSYMLRAALGDRYEFRVLDLTRQPVIPNEVDLLMMVKPEKPFTEQEKFKIDQFVMRGGKLLCFIDNLYAEMDSFRRKPDMVAFDRGLNLEDLFFRYGARINTDLVMGLDCEHIFLQVGGTNEQPQHEFLRWNYFPFLLGTRGKLQTEGYVGTRFANSVDTIAVPGVQKYPLLITGERARTLRTPALISLNENSTLPENKKFNRPGIPAAVLLEGKFTSLFKNKASLAQQNDWKMMGQTYRKVSEETAMILVADGDIVLNDTVPTPDKEGNFDPERGPFVPLEMGWNAETFLAAMTQQPEGKYFMPVSNKDFYLNALEYLLGNPVLAESRNKEVVLRLLDGPLVKEQKFRWQLLSIGLPLALLAIGGFLYRAIRKKLYAS